MFGDEVCVEDEATEKTKSGVLVALHESTTLALFPTIAVGSGRGFLQLTVVSSMTNSGTLSAAAEGASETAGTTLENILKSNKSHYTNF